MIMHLKCMQSNFVLQTKPLPSTKSHFPRTKNVWIDLSGAWNGLMIEIILCPDPVDKIVM
jgi:hypothetical protein